VSGGAADRAEARTRETSLRSMRSRIGACTPYTFRAIVSLRLSCVSFHCGTRTTKITTS
jgi:hypothetical protein